MQKLVFILCCVVLLGWSCGGKNKAEEAAKLTAEAATLTTSIEQAKSDYQVAENKVTSLGGINNIPDSSEIKLFAKAGHRFERLIDKGDTIKKDMEQLASDYAAGKITEEAYEQQLKVLRESAAKFELQVKKTSEDVTKAVQ